MKFGVFYQIPLTPPQTVERRYQETIAQIRHADRLGFDTVWLAEGHFRPIFSILPAPLLLAAALAGQTERIRLGTAAIQLPLHHPVRIAEEAAMVDVLSGGRLEFGVGRGSSLPNAEAFGLTWAERDDRFVEQLDVIAQAWRDGVVNYDGVYYRHQNLTVIPRPLQQPAPPVSITANHPEMATFTGARGLNLLVGAAIHPLPDAFFTHLARYRDAFTPTPGGRPRPYVGAVFWVFPGRDLADVRERIGSSLANNHIAAKLTFEQVAQTFAFFGSPTECADQIAALQERARLDEIICHFNPGGLVPHEQVIDAMTLFTDEVAARFTTA